MEFLEKIMEVEFDKNQTPLNRWENLDFLNGIPEIKKEIVANNFEKIALFFVKSKLEIIVFPIIYKIFKENNDIIDIDIPKLFISIFVAYQKIKTKSNENPDLELDFEKEICIEAVNQYIK